MNKWTISYLLLLIININQVYCENNKNKYDKLNETKLIHSIPGPPEVYYVNDNGVIVKVDFSDIEFFPVEVFPLLSTSNQQQLNEINSSKLTTLRTDKEKTIIKMLINKFNDDQVNELKSNQLINANDIKELKVKYKDFNLTPYSIELLGTEVLMQKKFNKYSIEANFNTVNNNNNNNNINNIKYINKNNHKIFGKFNNHFINNNSNNNINNNKHRKQFAMIRVQHRINFGRKVIRFAFWQSLNNGKPRDIWLTDDIMWRGVSLKPIGKLHTPKNGWAIMWTN